MNRHICILGALREEINLIRRQMTVDKQFKIGQADGWTGNWKGTHIFLVRTGVGKVRALNGLKGVLRQANPSLILSIGYAGGLASKLNVGDVVLADNVLEVNSDLNDIGCYSIDSKELELLERLTCSEKIVTHRGKLITVDSVVDDSAIKQELASRYNALAIDMETAALVALAAEKKITFLSVRSISDTYEQSLVDVSSFIDDGEVSKLKAGWYVITHPHAIKNFMSLRRQSQRATRNMTEFIGIFLQTYQNFA